MHDRSGASGALLPGIASKGSDHAGNRFVEIRCFIHDDCVLASHLGYYTLHHYLSRFNDCRVSHNTQPDVLRTGKRNCGHVGVLHQYSPNFWPTGQAAQDIIRHTGFSKDPSEKLSSTDDRSEGLKTTG